MPEENEEQEEVTMESVGAEAESAAISHTLRGLEDVPEKPEELAAMVRENVPGLDNASDDEVIEAYRKTIAGEEQEAEVTEAAGKETAPAFAPEGYGFYDGKGVAHELTAEQIAFLSDIQIGYRALGKDHMRGLNDVVRTASRGHFNQNQTDQYKADNDRLSGDLATANERVGSFDSQKAEWDRILGAAYNGQTEPFLQAVQAYAEAIGRPVDPRIAEYEARIATMEADREGERIVEQEVRPYLRGISTRFNIPSESFQQLEDYALDKIGAIPEHLASADRIAQYLQVELLSDLADMGYNEAVGTGLPESTGNAPPPGPESDVSKQLTTMAAEIANLKNAAAATDASSGPPGSVPGGSSDGAKSELAGAKTAEDYWAALRKR